MLRGDDYTLIVKLDREISGRSIYLELVPHLAFACAEGTRLEVRSNEGGVVSRGPNGASGPLLGCGTVIELLDDDRLRVRIDNIQLADGATGSAGSERPKPRNMVRQSTASFKKKARDPAQPVFAGFGELLIDASPINVRPITAAHYEPGCRLLFLHQEAGLVDAVVVEWLQFGARHQLQLVETGQLLEADLNQYNHSSVGLDGPDATSPTASCMRSVSDYRAARAAYCEALLQAHETVVEAFSGKRVEVAKQLVFVTPHTASANPKLEGVRRVRDVVAILAEPSLKRPLGFHSVEPMQMRAGSVHQAQREWLLTNVLYKLTATLRDADEAGTVPLVPLLLRHAVIASFITANMNRVHQLIDEGAMLRELIGLAASKFGESAEMGARVRELLLQALSMCALVVVVEYALQDDVAFMGPIIEAFVHKELMLSGHRFVLIGSSDVALPLPEAATLSMESFGLNFREWVHFRPDASGALSSATADYSEVSSTTAEDGDPQGRRSLELGSREYGHFEKRLEAAKLISEIHSSRMGKMVSALHLGSNPLEHDASAAASAWLRSPSCVLRSLDLSYTGLQMVDWKVLCAGLHANASLTFLDVRAWPPVADSVLGTLGRSLLDPGSPLSLRFARTNAFDVLEGIRKLSLEETAMGTGAICMLAGVLKHNAMVREVNLSAAGVTSEGAAALAIALRANSALAVLRLLHNPLESAGLAHLHEAIAERVSTGHPLQVDLPGA